ncbi:gamma-glutamyl-gamma-aminobutyrate hydrolase family protein [Oceanobacillus halotolerans]|uniref:gamma-glutamyl-gamma-aminobutyrate hydrolase family protein n=1 Tax=Oceanobacillus halotolerans TaxID=2663380 RepID=UPI0013D98EFD|nr:gamma-glutamyl-gamma-aminobutyrate hydrolase family protein [Oceanobacillus halotolerans]
MKKLIGITTSMEVDKTYYKVAEENVNAITQAGGMPVMLPYLIKEDIDELAHQLDGLYATGGYDIDPILFGEEPHPKLGTIIPARDHFEITLMKKMLALDKPILAVCRGCQTLNIAAGGDMYQDIYAQIDHELLQHQQKAPKDHGSHFVHVLEGSLLHRLTNETKLKVNSRHHQANRAVKEPFQVSGTASDDVLEAIESKHHTFALGLQWHPENMLVGNDEPSRKIYEGFLRACAN